MHEIESYRMNETNRRKGSVLIIAMWALSVLTIFSIALGMDSRSKMTFISRIGSRNKLRYIASSGVKKAIATIASKGADPQYDMISEFGGVDMSSNYGDTVIGDGKYTIGYKFYDPSSKEIKLWQGVNDSESRINLNKADYNVISSIVKIASNINKKDADDIAAAIIDWRDTDDFPLMNGAESRYYLSLKPPYTSKSNEFEVIEELKLVRGITEEIYESILPYVTIYGTGKVNINTAREVVLASLGIDKTLAGKIIKYRIGLDRIEGTYDDNVFTSPGAITAELSQVISLSSGEVAKLANLSSMDIISVVSSAFKIRSVGRIGKRDAVLEVVCVYDRAKADSGENAVKYWHERYYTDPLPVEEDL